MIIINSKLQIILNVENLDSLFNLQKNNYFNRMIMNVCYYS